MIVFVIYKMIINIYYLIINWLSHKIVI